MATLQTTDLFPVGRGAATYKVSYGDVKGGFITVAASAPTSPASGDLWLKTGNKVLYTYDGSVWVG